MTIALVVFVGLLAFANGSNDNGKGVATMVGFGVAKPFHALLFAKPAGAGRGPYRFTWQEVYRRASVARGSLGVR